MENISNPFTWDFTEQRSIVTLAKRGDAVYNEPRETVENIPSYPYPTEEDENASLKTHFFDQEFGTSSNPAHVIGISPIEPTPYIVETSSTTDTDDETVTEDTEDTTATDGEDTTITDGENS